MKEISNSKEIESELTRIFNRFNHHFWADELPEVIITFKPTRNAFGHMTSLPVWISDSSENNKYELNIDAFTINRKPEEICETILHEQCHLYCRIKNIKETSNNHRYHNSHFKKIAEEHGLNCEKDKNYGWTITTLSEDALKYVKKLNIKKAEYRYVKPKRKKTLVRYQCPCCGKATAWVSSKQNLICGDCHHALIETPASNS